MPKKKQPKLLYKKEETLGEDREFSPPYLIPRTKSSTFIGEGSSLIMCPYTEFIPLAYLMSSDVPQTKYPLSDHLRATWKIDVVHRKKLDKFNKKWQNRILSMFPSFAMRRDKEEMKRLTEAAIRGWMRGDGCMDLDSLGINLYGVSNRNEIVESFWRNDTVRIDQRSYSGAISPYSLYLNEAMGMKIPHILAVILPENYLYVKHHLLVHDTIPLDKVVVLVNKELDETSFAPAAFRKLYKDLMFKVLKSSCDVWKVPLQFILDNCFLGDYKLKEENISKRKREVDEIIDEFYKSFKKEELGDSFMVTAGSASISLTDIGSRTWWGTTGTSITSDIVVPEF
jgi:hypothetical protein